MIRRNHSLATSRSLMVNSSVCQLLKSHVPSDGPLPGFSSVFVSTMISSRSVGVSIASGRSGSHVEGEDDQT